MFPTRRKFTEMRERHAFENGGSQYTSDQAATTNGQHEGNSHFVPSRDAGFSGCKSFRSRLHERIHKPETCSYTNPNDNKWTPQEARLHNTEVRRDIAYDQAKSGASNAGLSALQTGGSAYMGEPYSATLGGATTAWNSKEALANFRQYQRQQMLMDHLQSKEKEYLKKN